MILTTQHAIKSVLKPRINVRGCPVRSAASANLHTTATAISQSSAPAATFLSRLTRSECLLNLSCLLHIITETTASELSAPLRPLNKQEAPAKVVETANPTHMAELSLTTDALYHWANLAFSLQGIAKEYEPTGHVACMDIFYAIPLAAVAQSKKEWVEGPLSKWRDFVREAPRYHEVDGAHYTMISPEHVQRFAKKLKSVLQARGL